MDVFLSSKTISENSAGPDSVPRRLVFQETRQLRLGIWKGSSVESPAPLNVVTSCQLSDSDLLQAIESGGTRSKASDAKTSRLFGNRFDMAGSNCVYRDVIFSKRSASA